MDNQTEILARIFVGFDDILSRYQRFNQLFFDNLQGQIQNNPIAEELIKSYQSNLQNKNGQNEQLLNLEPNMNNLLIAEANLQSIFELLKKYKNDLKNFFDSNEIKFITDNAADYLFGLQHLVISIDIKMDLFIDLLQSKKIDKKAILSLKDLKDELITYTEISNLRDVVAHNDAIVDDEFRKDFKLSKKGKDNISFCLAGLGKIEQYIHDYTVIILYVSKRYLDADIFTCYNTFECSKKIKLTEEEILKINQEKK